MGKIIDAEFGGLNAGDRYCPACRERYPRRSTLCPRCGGPLALWATHSAAEQKRRRVKELVSWAVTGVLVVVVLVVAAILSWGRVALAG